MHTGAFFKNIFRKLERYERHISSAALVSGFVIDNLTLTRIDFWIDHVVIVAYIFVAAASIVVAHLPQKRNLISRIQPFAPLPMQFAFGGLFSSFFVFYSRSTAISSSWLFLLMLAGLLIGNEFFKRRYERLAFQLAIFFVVIFSYSVFVVPVLTKTIGPKTFLLSGALSIALMAVFVALLSIVAPRRMREERAVLLKVVVAIFAIMNILYFLNIIPPIPLALKEAGVYYSVTRTRDGNYVLDGERAPFFSFLRPQTMRIAAGKPLYFYSAVFAPTELSTRIVHVWEYFDESRDEWMMVSRIPFTITGGRDGGYRGYSLKTDLSSGLWRVSVETEPASAGWRGQILGRTKFLIQQIH